ncbi:hypothetical protein, partial [Prevotella sp.]
PTTFATFPSWRIRRELAVKDLPVFSKASAKVVFFCETANYQTANFAYLTFLSNLIMSKNAYMTGIRKKSSKFATVL